MVTTSLVVARYNEDIDWLQEYASRYPLYLYNKGDTLPSNAPGRIKQLPNVGRESHTYLTHIIEHYDQLPDLLICWQAKIDDLGPWVHRDPGRYVAQALQYGFSASAYSLMTPTQWLAIDFLSDAGYADAFRDGSLLPAELSMIDYAFEHVGPLPLLTLVSLKGCFAVSQRAILARPKHFYERLRDTISHHSNPVEGHYLERLWAYMFSGNSLLPTTLKLPLDCRAKFQINAF